MLTVGWSGSNAHPDTDNDAPDADNESQFARGNAIWVVIDRQPSAVLRLASSTSMT